MAWKKKEKELTPEEAIKQAKASLEPYWYWSTPLLAAVRGENGNVSAVPLDDSFVKKTWLMVFLDPLDFGGENCFHYFLEWKKRFADQDIQFLLVLRMPYAELRNARSVAKVMETWKIQVPTTLDVDGSLGEAFEAIDLPAILLMQKGKFVLARTGRNWREGTEAEIQQFLRIADPGLPLRPPFVAPQQLRDSILRFDFGAGAPEAWKFPYPAGVFKDQGKGVRVGEFRSDIPRELLASPQQLIGRWSLETDRIVTDDPKAALVLRSPGTCFSIVALSLTKTTDPAKIYIDFNNGPVFESIQGEHLTVSEDGQGILILKELKLYHVLEHLPEGEREITLRFPSADTEPLALYGLRFGK